jgi:hypothetical protein
VCVFDEESLDPTVLQAAYQIVRLDAIRTVQRAAIQVDTARVQHHRRDQPTGHILEMTIAVRTPRQNAVTGRLLTGKATREID